MPFAAVVLLSPNSNPRSWISESAQDARQQTRGQRWTETTGCELGWVPSTESTLWSARLAAVPLALHLSRFVVGLCMRTLPTPNAGIGEFRAGLHPPTGPHLVSHGCRSPPTSSERSLPTRASPTACWYSFGPRCGGFVQPNSLELRKLAKSFTLLQSSELSLGAATKNRRRAMHPVPMLPLASLTLLPFGNPRPGPSPDSQYQTSASSHRNAVVVDRLPRP
jgi:hypothetical protein